MFSRARFRLVHTAARRCVARHHVDSAVPTAIHALWLLTGPPRQLNAGAIFRLGLEIILTSLKAHTPWHWVRITAVPDRILHGQARPCKRNARREPVMRVRYLNPREMRFRERTANPGDIAPNDLKKPHKRVRTRVARSCLLLAALVAGLTLPMLAVAKPAYAATLTQHVYNTAGLGLYLHPDSPTLASATSEIMPDGTEFDVSCYTTGDDVSGDDVWDYGTDVSTGATGYAADYYIDTPVTQGEEAAQLSALGLPACSTTSSEPTAPPSSGSAGTNDSSNLATPFSYDRNAAVQFAIDNLKVPESFPGDDCTWYVSQALWAGGLPQSAQWTGKSWDWSLQAARSHYPGPTKDAADANDLINYLVSTGLAIRIPITWSDNTAAGAEPGDIIAYHWNNNEPADKVDHLAFVTDLNADGYPEVMQHSPEVHRYWSWDPGGNGHTAGWIQYVDRPNGSDPEAWLIHIDDSPSF